MRTRPWTMLLAMLAGWLNRHHQDVIEYLKEENKILREKIGKKRIILNDNQGKLLLPHSTTLRAGLARMSIVYLNKNSIELEAGTASFPKGGFCGSFAPFLRF